MSPAITLGQASVLGRAVLPAATGSGAALFAGLDHVLPLRLVTSRAFPSGILELVYAPRR